MEYTYKIIDTEKYKLYDKFKNGIFEYRAINPTNNDKRNNHNSFFAKRALWSEDLHLGEFLSGLIGKKQGFIICENSLYRDSFNHNDYGVISYVELSQDDIIITPKRIILRLFKKSKYPLWLYSIYRC